jgi:hypothetical protein
MSLSALLLHVVLSNRLGIAAALSDVGLSVMSLVCEVGRGHGAGVMRVVGDPAGVISSHLGDVVAAVVAWGATL